MDAASRRPQLAALSYLDIDKTNREDEGYQDRNAGTPQTQNRGSAASPTYPHPLGPPPPYSHAAPQQPSSWSSLKSDVHPPVETNRPSGDEYEHAKIISRQSLPSISEALGDSKTSYSTSTSTRPAPLQAQAPSSPSPTIRRTFGIEPPQSYSSYGANSAYKYPSTRQDSAGPLSYQPPDASNPLHASSQDPRPPLHLQTVQPPRTEQQEKYTYSTSHQYDQPSSKPLGPMAPPSLPYGYTPYPSRFAEATPPSSQSSGPIYQPSSQYAPPPSPSSWKTENASSRFSTEDRSSGSATYGESVKRHLEMYDIEAGFNDITSSSSFVLDFSRRYSDRMHHAARTGPSLASLPSRIEVEDMITKSQLQLEALNKIRDVILAEQVAYEQQIADQHQHAKQFRDGPPRVADSHAEVDDSKGGYPGSDAKKRRGRAAPPGRCHSCHRAETPEWRRGPDGARTLCNACGLHYAKLTRKQNTASKTANVGSSNLRPKEP